MKLDINKISKFDKSVKEVYAAKLKKPFDTLELKTFKESLKKANKKITELKKDVFNPTAIEEKFNPDYVKPIQTEFTSYISVQNYAKNRAVEALKTDKPYEHLILIDKKTNKVIGEYKGTSQEVNEGVLGMLKSNSRVSQVHGHPTMFLKDGKPVTSPVSWPDFVAVNHKGEEIFAYNIRGEYSVIRKQPGYIKLPDDKIQYYEQKYMQLLNKKFVETRKSLFPKEFEGIKTLEDFEKKCLELSKTLKDKKRRNEIDKQLQKLLTEFNESFDVIEAVHEFWKKYADEMGLIYKTNFSYLK